MAGISAVAGNVGAGVGQVRSAQSARLKDQGKPVESVRAAPALELIQRALATSGAAGHDLDVLA